ncbi:MAG: four helix bundle protein [Flavobacteriales bacterium]|nr:four helix bundle protein [Flavobacteriales bacterium]
MRNYKELSVWQRSMEMSASAYVITKNLPAAEKFGIVSQLNRAAVSVACNIAEGSARSSDKEFKRFLEISLGSAYECETLILTCVKVELITEADSEEFRSLLTEVQKMLYVLIRKLNANN